MRANRSDSSFIVKLLRNSVLIMLLIVFVSIIYNFHNRESATETALMSEAVASKEMKAVFIRDETPVLYSGNGILSYNVRDGGKLGCGTVIAQVYPDDSQISRNRRIQQLEKELDILKKIQNPGTLESAQPASLSESMSESYRSLIYSRETGDYDSLRNTKDDFLVQMSTYQIITKQVTGFGQQINDINAELAELKAASAAPTETIKSPKSAYFVSYCDGYESELTPDKLSSLTIAGLNSISDRKSSDPAIVGKLIEGYGWYIAGAIDNSRKDYAIGDSVKLRFETSAETFDAEITDIRSEEGSDESIIIIKCSQFNYDLVQHRSEKCEIIRGKGHYSGLKVPREAIRFSDIEEYTYDDDGNVVSSKVTNYKGVYIRKGEQILFKKIDVIYEGSDYILSAVHSDDDDYLALYDDMMMEGVENSGK